MTLFNSSLTELLCGKSCVLLACLEAHGWVLTGVWNSLNSVRAKERDIFPHIFPSLSPPPKNLLIDLNESPNLTISIFILFFLPTSNGLYPI